MAKEMIVNIVYGGLHHQCKLISTHIMGGVQVTLKEYILSIHQMLENAKKERWNKVQRTELLRKHQELEGYLPFLNRREEGR